ncbi:carboxypeptidase-like regulatory domain-containing protein [Corallococcus sicarius]|uniref:Carboxypeptidase regulatory-like domain-containing protein n=1 Tax=Corallococcus sicarius TaxID=2316726 RepID=A0A3A8NKT1_9BACT|nr:carboxypeptidase-like regulatory domain-containing protein [Corallococcus sicarius]RKH40572.1 carboxypeptidase regulatory-like domain-containing protein [Corallococcus sicarius]
MRQGIRSKAWMGVAVIVGLLLALYLRERGASSNRAARKASTAAATSARTGATTRAMPVPDGSLRITGVARDAQGPVAGVRVSASRVEPEETLSERSCPPSEDSIEAPGAPPARLKDCWTRAYDEVVTEVSALTGEARVLAETTTGEDGSFVLDGLPEGAVTLWGLSEQGAGRLPGVTAGKQDVVLALEDGLVFEGVVKDGASADQPFPGARVTVFSHEHTRFFTASTDASGRFRIGPLPRAYYAALITAEDRGPLLFQRAHALGSEELTLLRPARFAGQVVSRAGTPVPGIRVHLHSYHRNHAFQLTTTDAQGRFSILTTANPNQGILFAETAEHDAFVELKTLPRDNLVLTLQPGVFLEGTVRDDAGRPVLGAQVDAQPWDEGGPSEQGRAVTDAKGHYRLGPLPPLAHWVEVKAAHYVDVQPLRHPLDTNREPLDFTLRRAVSVEGLLVDAEGAPLPGRKVGLNEGSLFRLRPLVDTTRTDASGHFVLDAETAGPGVLTVDDEAFIPQQLAVDLPSREVRMVLQRGARVSVTVLSAAGAPMQGLFVQLWKGKEWGESERSGATDEQGRVTLQGVKPGTYVVEASLQAQSLEQDVSQALEITDSGDVEVSLRMEEGRSLRGVVVDARGQPLPGVAIGASLPYMDVPRYRARSANCGDGRPDGVLTDAEGRFTLRHLSAPRYSLTAWREEYTFDLSRSQGGSPHASDSLLVGEDVSEVRLVMRRNPHVRGRAVAEGGGPLEDFEVNGQKSRTPDGSFDLTVEDTRPWRLRLSARGFAPLERTLTPEDTDVDLGVLTLKRGRTVRVLLRDAETGALFNGRVRADTGELATVTVSYRIRAEGDLDGGRSSAREVRGVPKQDGTLLLEHLPTTAFTLELDAPSFLPLRRVVGAEEEAVTVPLEKGARVKGHVRDDQGRPIEARILFIHSDGTVDDRTPDPGAFSFRALRPGLYTVNVYPFEAPPEVVFPPRTVHIPQSGEITLTFDALGPGTVLTLGMTEDVGTVFLLPGQVPTPGNAKAFNDLEPLQHPGGRWAGLSMKFRRVPAGHYTVQAVSRAEDRIHREELDVPAQGTLSRDVRPVWTPLAR